MSEIARNRSKVRMLLASLKKKQKIRAYDVDKLSGRIGSGMLQDFSSMAWLVLDDIPAVMAEADQVSDLIPNSHKSLLNEKGIDKLRGLLRRVEELVDEVKSVTGKPHNQSALAIQDFRESLDFYEEIRQELHQIREDTKRRKTPVAAREAYFTDELYKGIRPGLSGREAYISEKIREDLDRMLGYIGTRFEQEGTRKLSKAQLVRSKVSALVLLPHEIEQLFRVGAVYDDPRDLLPGNWDSLLEQFSRDHCDDFAKAGAKKIASLINEKIHSISGPLSIESKSDSEMNVEWVVRGERGLKVSGKAYVENETRRGQPDQKDAHAMRGHRQYCVEFSFLEYRQGNEKVAINNPDSRDFRGLSNRGRAPVAKNDRLHRSISGISLTAS